MAIREEVVASAAHFLQDPSVASSSIENRISFLRTKNLTQEEIDAALARAGGQAPPSQPPVYYASGSAQQYYAPYAPQAWQQPPQARRDWRDLFIAATVASGLTYSLYSMGKRYLYPLIAPPTPERLEQDKKSVEDQFDKAFALVEQLSSDMEELKTSERQRTGKLDDALEEMEKVIADLKLSNRRREDDAERLRDEVKALKDAIPKAMDNQKDITDSRLKEINNELTSLKTLVSQRFNASTTVATSGNSLRSSAGAREASPSGAAAGRPTTLGEENGGAGASVSSEAATEAPKSLASGSFHAASPSVNGNRGGKASIPAWQMAMASKGANETSAITTEQS